MISTYLLVSKIMAAGLNSNGPTEKTVFPQLHNQLVDREADFWMTSISTTDNAS